MLVLLGLFRIVLRSFFGIERMAGMGWLIDVDEEGNLPTLFTVILLLIAGSRGRTWKRRVWQNDTTCKREVGHRGLPIRSG